MSTAATLDPQQVLAVACALVHNGSAVSADELELALLDAYGIDINSFASLLAALAREGLLSPVDSPALPVLHSYDSLHELRPPGPAAKIQHGDL